MSLTSDPLILSWVKGYKIPFQSKVIQKVVPTEYNWSNQERKEIRNSISSLLNKGVIRSCEQTEGQFISKIFLVPKQSGGFRLVLNLKQLNKFVHTEHFKLEDHKTVIRLLKKGCFMASVDLTDAYYLISVREADRKYLRFIFEGILFEFLVLPFGLSSAPYVFTKILKPLISILRNEGFKSVIYLDDLLLLADSYFECNRNVSRTIELLEFLGFLINKQKSQLVPVNEIQYLGFVYNSIDMTVALPDSKILKLSSQIDKFINLQNCTIRVFAQFIGLLVSACPAIPYGWLYTKLFEREKFLALIKNHNNYDAVMSIPKSLKDEFRWWQCNVASVKNPIRDTVFSLEIFSDASRSGWGIFCDGRKSHGFWSVDDLVHDINFLELKAAFFGLKCFAKGYRNCQILLRIDNTTAIAYINRMGSVQFVELSKVAREIWRWCEQRNIWIVASYIPSKENVEADFESRRLKTETEYELSSAGFNKIVNTLGCPDIDLFASRANNKCRRYVSWLPDPDAFTIDAFTVSWKPFFFYAFPPFAILLKVLQKIRSEKARGIVVVPLWPAQPWYPEFIALLCSDLVILEPQDNLLFSFDRQPHPLRRNLTLAAGICSG